MATVRMMYWKEIPVQVQAEDDNGKVSRPLDPRFQEAVDAVAMLDGSAGTDAYLDGWGFGPFFEVDGPAKEAAESVASRFDADMPGNFVARIRDLLREGKRDETPGTIDSWAGIDPR